MEAKDWEQVETLFHASVELNAAQRADFLAEACAGDAALQAEVESLLASFDEEAAFLEKPIFEVGLQALAAEANASLAAQTIGAYRIEKLLGKGGMGEVYLAEDTRLGRWVALKFLARRLAANSWARRQLVKEAQAVAQLDHPNICAVYGLEEADGYSFIVMQYVEGQLLSDLLRAQRLTAAEALPLAVQMTSALTAAHEHGIIHRDIKPQNMMLTASGQLKVLDFGLAKVIQRPAGTRAERLSAASRQGLIAGTVAYMSPEQLRAERLDYRSDLFSLGIVLYEMIGGRHPFARTNDADTISAILASQPLPLPAESPADLTALIHRCLQEQKEQRYQSASELLLSLQTLELDATQITPRRHGNKWLAAALTVLLLFGLFAFNPTPVQTLAIMPFGNETRDPQFDYLTDGLADSLAQRLSQEAALKLKPPTTVAGYKGKTFDAQQAGRELNVAAILTGKAEPQGQSAILHVELLSVADGRQLWAEAYDLQKVDALTLYESITQKTLARLHADASTTTKSDAGGRARTNNEAFQQYMRGRYYWNKRDQQNIELAIACFKKAIEHDPAYAAAWAGLADSYVLLNTVLYGKGKVPTPQMMNLTQAAAKRALELDDTLPEAHNTLGVIKLKYDWDWPGAEAAFQRALQLNADYAPTHYWYSNLLAITGRQSAALRESELAKNLDPFSTSARINYCRNFYYERRFGQASVCLDEILRDYPGQTIAQYVQGFVYLQQGRREAALQLFQQLYAGNRPQAIAALGYTYGRMGRKAEALKALAEAEEIARTEYLPPLERAIIYLGLGNYDKTFEWLERAYAEKFASLTYVTIDPALDELHTDPRFIDLARRLQLTLPRR